MTAFDRLPPIVRRRLDEGAFNYDARAVAEARRCFGLSAAELIQFIDALDAHARRVIAGAVASAGSNRMFGAEPDDEAIVALIRSKSHDRQPRAA